MISNEMVIYFNMFGSSVQYGISSKMCGTEIVTGEDWRSEERNVKFGE